jgi:hypothetical protein
MRVLHDWDNIAFWLDKELRRRNLFRPTFEFPTSKFPIQLVSFIHRTENGCQSSTATPKVQLDIFIEKAIQKNLDEQGDGKWLVKIRFSNVLDTNRTCVNWIFILF